MDGRTAEAKPQGKGGHQRFNRARAILHCHSFVVARSANPYLLPTTDSLTSTRFYTFLHVLHGQKFRVIRGRSPPPLAMPPTSLSPLFLGGFLALRKHENTNIYNLQN